MTDRLWRALAVLVIVVLGALPSASFRDLARAHDWYFHALELQPAILVEARKGWDIPAASAHDAPQAARWQHEISAPTHAAPRVAPERVPLRVAPARLLPNPTGPPPG